MMPFVYARQAQFAECDPAGILHFSRVACWVEEAEHACLAAAGFPLNLQAEDALLWPRVSFEVEYLAPIPLHQEFELRLLAVKPGKSSLTWTWELGAGEQLFARGSLKTVCCRREGEGLRPQALPDALREL